MRAWPALIALAFCGAAENLQSIKVSFREWNVSTRNALPQDPTLGPDGALWYTELIGNKLGRLDPRTGETIEFPMTVPDSGPHGLAVDKAGDIWFTADYKGYIGRLDPRSGKIDTFPMPDPRAKDSLSLVVAPDGSLLFTVQEGNFVGRLDPRIGKITLKALPTPGAQPYGIAMSPLGIAYFCEFGTNKIGRFDPLNMQIVEFDLPPDARPRRLAFSGSLIYYTDFRRGKLGMLDPMSSGIKEWDAPGGAGSLPYAIAAMPDGRIWFVETGLKPNRLVAFDPVSQRFLSWPIPFGGGVVRDMVAAPGRRLYLTYSSVGKVAVVTIERGGAGH